jgi:hypothetical protein
MGGTRYHARGVDEDGNASNHVEIEQICAITQEHDQPLKFVNPTGEQGCITKTTIIYSHV